MTAINKHNFVAHLILTILGYALLIFVYLLTQLPTAAILKFNFKNA